MPSVTMTFDLTTERQAHIDALCGTQYLSLIRELDDSIRRVLKYDIPPDGEAREILEGIRSQIAAGLQDILNPL